jgi:hypothetical protein
MKQSAVEWLFEQVANLDWRNLQGEEKIKIFDKAKEMEKQQVVNAYVVANGMLIEHSKPMAEQYYDETIKVKNTLKKVLVKYMIFQDAPHPLLDGEWIEKSKVIEVYNLTEVNKMFQNISDIKVLQ